MRGEGVRWEWWEWWEWSKGEADVRIVWKEWEDDVERKKALGVQAELDRRREAERMKAEIKGSIK